MGANPTQKFNTPDSMNKIVSSTKAQHFYLAADAMGDGDHKLDGHRFDVAHETGLAAQLGSTDSASIDAMCPYTTGKFIVAGNNLTLGIFDGTTVKQVFCDVALNSNEFRAIAYDATNGIFLGSINNGSSGKYLVRSTDGLQTFAFVASMTFTATELLVLSNGSIVAVGASHVAYSTDHGATWTEVSFSGVNTFAALVEGGGSVALACLHTSGNSEARVYSASISSLGTWTQSAAFPSWIGGVPITAGMYASSKFIFFAEGGHIVSFESGLATAPTFHNVDGTAGTKTVTFSTNPSDDDELDIGATGQSAYVFKTTLTGAANQVKIGATLADTIDNLKAAINLEAGSGTKYSAGITAANWAAYVSASDATSITLTTRLAGTYYQSDEHLVYPTGCAAISAPTTNAYASGGTNGTNVLKAAYNATSSKYDVYLVGEKFATASDYTSTWTVGSALSSFNMSTWPGLLVDASGNVYVFGDNGTNAAIVKFDSTLATRTNFTPALPYGVVPNLTSLSGLGGPAYGWIAKA